MHVMGCSTGSDCRIGRMLAHALQRSKLPRPGIEDLMGEFRSKIKQTIPGLQIEVLQLMEDFIGDLSNVPQPPGPCLGPASQK
jgi:hypothetical protein